MSASEREVEDKIESLNPYAAPTAELEPERKPVGYYERAAYYPMSSVKAFVMSALTLGVYDLVFWWRHWRTQRDQGRDVSVFWRTFFAAFCAFEFKNSLSIALVGRNQQLHPMLHSAPLIYFLAGVGDNVLSRLAGNSTIVIVISCMLEVVRASMLFVLQKSANQLLEADGYQGLVNRGASAKTYLAGLGGLLLWALVIAGMVLPD